MVTIIAGSRDIEDYSLLEQAIKDSGFHITEIVSGGARGVDKLGEKYAENNGIKKTVFKADWDKYGNSAGPIRNTEMAKYAAEHNGALIAIWDGNSSGTKDMINKMRKLKLKVYIHYF